MNPTIRAGIDLHGRVLRYAEVERSDDGYRLLRLGSCDFDFDAGAEVFGNVPDRHLPTLIDALADVFSGSTAGHLNVALHPPVGYSFFTPLPRELAPEEREERLVQEIALLTTEAGGRVEELQFTSDAVFDETLPDGRAVSWHHVMALREHVSERLERVFRGLPYPRHRLMASMQAVLPLLLGDGFRLALGLYPDHAEYVLCQDETWRFSHYAAAADPADAVFFAITLLSRIGLAPRDLAAVHLYGPEARSADPAMLRAVFHREAAWLDPMQIVTLEPDGLPADFESEAYAACIGVAMAP